MRATQLAVWSALSLMLATGTAQAATDGFESYAVGSVIDGQGDWTGWGGVSAAAQEKVSDTVSHSGEKSLQIIGTDADVVRLYSGLTAGVVEMTTWQYFPASSTTGNTYYILMNTYNNVPEGPFKWSSQLTFDLDAGTVRESMHQTSTEDGGVDNTLNILKDQWVEIKHVIDLDNDWVTITYGGQLMAEDEWVNGGAVEIAALDLYSPDDNTVYYDDVRMIRPGQLPGDANGNGFVDDNDLSLVLANWGKTVGWDKGEFSGEPPVNDNDLSLLLANWTGPPPAIVVPEPTGLALCALGGLGLLRPKRR